MSGLGVIDAAGYPHLAGGWSVCFDLSIRVACVYTIRVHHCSTGWGWGPCLSIGKALSLHVVRVSSPLALNVRRLRILVSREGLSPADRKDRNHEPLISADQLHWINLKQAPPQRP